MSAEYQDVALLVLESDHAPVPVVAATAVEAERRLEPLYYLQNLRLALAALKDRYIGLLNAQESLFIERFEGLPKPTQCLLARLVMRKGPLFRRATLQYVEVSDLEKAIQDLARLGWLDPDPLLCADELSRVLNPEELRLAVGIQRVRVSRSGPAGLPQLQLVLPLQDAPVVHRALADWNARLAGSVVRLCIAPLIRSLQLLFFGNDVQTWAEFVLTDLGLKRYESVAIDSEARAFQSREEIEHFYRLHECRARLDQGEPASAVLGLAAIPQTVCSWLRAQFMQLQIRLGEHLEVEGDEVLALQSYRASHAAEGLIRAVRLQERLELHEEALRDARAALELPCGEAQKEAIERALARILRRQGGKRTSRKVHEKPEVVELLLKKCEARQRIELAVVEQLGQPDSPVFYVENSLLSSLFGLLCWEALFAPIQGAFFHPFQAAPADLYTAEFRARRAPRLDSLLGLLDTGEHETVIRHMYRAKSGLRSHFVRWGKLRPGLLTLALQCIPAAHLRLCFERLLDDLQENTTGLPDLIQFWPAERCYRLIEVKGPGDRLQDNQRRWMRFFAQHSIPAAVCQVRWEQPE